jgi:hypothetical protein
VPDWLPVNPVASIATTVQPSDASQSAKASKPVVVVSNVPTSRLTVPSTVCRTLATTVSLCASRSAQELPWSLQTRAGVDSPLVNSNKRAPRSMPTYGTIWGAQGLLVKLKNWLASTKRFADLSAGDAPIA